MKLYSKSLWPLPWYPSLGVFAGIVLSLSLGAHAGSLDPEIIKFIDETITEAYFPKAKISKMGLTIVQNDGEILYTTGYGYANEEKGILNGNNTQFLIGSVTKSFTSTVIAKTLNELFPEMGEAVMDTPIRKLSPSANLTLIDRFRSEYATFRDLLAHRMCIFRDDYQLIAEPFSSTEEIVYRQRYAKEICGMRSEFQYNNQMYVIAAELIGIMANKSYLSLLDELLADIGMNNTKMVSHADDFTSMELRAQPYYVMDNKSFPINPDLIKRVSVNGAAGGLFVTPNDMARYMRFHLNKGSIDGKQIVPEHVMNWLVRPASSVFGMNYKAASDEDLVFNTFGYGTGLFLTAYDGWQQIQHGGYFPPYRSQMSLFPEKNWAIFSNTNEGPVYVDPLNLHAFIFETLRGTLNITEKYKRDWDKKAAVALEETTKKRLLMEKYIEESTINSNDINSFALNANEIVGKYGSGGSGEAEISERFNNETNEMGLYVSYGKWSKGWLQLVATPMYKVVWDTDVVQDNYASGDPNNFSYLRIQNGTLEFLAVDATNVYTLASFEIGVSLDTLPPIPWLPNSCGPDSS